MKQIIKFLIVTLLLSSVFSCKGQNRDSIHPPEKFSVVEGKLSNGKQVVGSINMAYKNYTRKTDYSWCLELNIALDLKNIKSDGLPVKKESDIANKFEDELLNEIGKIATVQYVGHLYNDSFLDVYVYLDNPEKVNQYLQTQVNKKDITRGFAYEIKQDPNWTIVQSFLR